MNSASLEASQAGGKANKIKTEANTETQSGRKTIRRLPWKWPCPKPTPSRYGVKYWNNYRLLNEDTIILHGNYSLASKRYGLMCSGKQCSSIALVALAFTHVLPVDEWNSLDMDKILDEGTQLYKRTITESKYKRGVILRPDQVLSNFYVNSDIKVIALTGSDVVENSWENRMMRTELEAFAELHDSFLFHCGDRTLVIWKDAEFWFIFNASDTNDDGYPALVTYGRCCCMGFKSFQNLLFYLLNMRNRTGRYQIYCLNILKLAQQPSEYDLFIVEENLNLEPDGARVPQMFSAGEDSSAVEMIDHGQEFTNDYATINPTCGILQATKFIEDARKIPMTNICAILMLHHIRARLWTTKKLDEILDMTLLDENANNFKHIQFYGQDYELDREQVVIGDVTSKNDNICDLLKGVAGFFKLHDRGLIQGPQNVAVWQEAGLYFMFDAKERDNLGVKFVHAENAGDGVKTKGMACLMWFKNLEDLHSKYMENVPINQRRYPFRLTKLEVVSKKGKTDDWNSWLALDYEKWIVRGSNTCKNQKFPEINRGQQTLCMSAMAIAFIQVEPLETWSAETLDNILTFGDGLYTKSLPPPSEPSEDNEEEKTSLGLNDIVRQYSNLIYRTEFLFEENIINGIILKMAQSQHKLNLENGLLKFFRENSRAILEACNVVMAIWKEKGYFYVFNANMCDSNGNNPVLWKTGCLGTSCAMRFAKFEAFLAHILSNLEIKPYDLYKLHRVDCLMFQDNIQPTLYHFTSLIPGPGAILRPIEPGCHEGNPSYDLRTNRQTICNVMVALAMSQLATATKWSSNYINDILDIGDKTFCRKINELEREVEDNSGITLEDLNSTVQIGTNQFTFAINISKLGQFIQEQKEDEGPLLETPPENSLRGSVVSERSRSRGLRVTNRGSQDEGSQRSEINVSKAGSAVLNSSQGDESSEPPIQPTLALVKAIEALDNTGQTIIIESPVITLAIWKQDALYFVFDPKSSDENGKISPDRLKLIRLKVGPPKKDVIAKNEDEEDDENDSIKPEPIDESNPSPEIVTPPAPPPAKKTSECPSTFQYDKSRAYVAWFNTLDQLYQHIISQIPAEYLNQNYNLHCIQFVEMENIIDASIIPGKKLFNFTNISKTMRIIRGTISQNDQSFQEYPNRNNQDSAICVISMCFTLFCKFSEWSSAVIDQVLKYGDWLHSKSIEWMKQVDPAMTFMQDTKLKLHHLASPFTIANMKFHLLVIPHVVDESRELLDNLGQFMSENAKGVIFCKNYGVAVFKEEDDVFCMFDPHDVGPNGVKRINGTACLLRFDTDKELLETFQRNCGADPVKDPVKMYIIKINKTDVQPDLDEPSTESNQSPVNVVQPSDKITPTIPEIYSSFKIFNDYCHILNGSTTTKNPAMMSTNTIIALITTQTINTEYWTEKTMEEILLYGESLATQEHALDLRSDNKIQKNLSKLRIEIETLLDEPLDSNFHIILDHFFEDYNMGVVVSDSGWILGVWYDQAHYFLYCPPTSTAVSYLLKFRSIKYLCKVMLEKISDSKRFKLKSCKLNLK